MWRYLSAVCQPETAFFSASINLFTKSPCSFPMHTLLSSDMRYVAWTDRFIDCWLFIDQFHLVVVFRDSQNKIELFMFIPKQVRGMHIQGFKTVHLHVLVGGITGVIYVGEGAAWQIPPVKWQTLELVIIIFMLHKQGLRLLSFRPGTLMLLQSSVGSTAASYNRQIFELRSVQESIKQISTLARSIMPLDQSNVFPCDCSMR